MGPRFLPLPASVVVTWCHRMGLTPRLADPAGAVTVGWRLVGMSNREVARGVVIGDLERAVRAVEEITRHADHLSIDMTSPVPGLWGWRASLDGQVVAASARLYRRRRESSVRAERFLAVAGVADLTPMRATAGAVRGRSA